MRLATGIDLVEIGRVQRSMQNPRFLKRVFSADERALFAQRGGRAETVAANFAAKEAFSKAMGTGLAGFALAEVSVLRDDRGAPTLALTGRAAALAAGAVLSVSLTHTREMAAATVTAIWPDEGPESRARHRISQGF